MTAPSESRPGDHGEGKPGQRVLEQVLHRAVVEQVLRLQIDPQAPGDARTRPGVHQELSGKERGIAFAWTRAKTHFPIPLRDFSLRGRTGRRR